MKLLLTIATGNIADEQDMQSLPVRNNDLSDVIC